MTDPSTDEAPYARIQTTETDIHLYELVLAENEEEMNERGDRLAELRVAHGIPEDWVAGDYPPPIRYDVSVISSPIHPKLLAKATLHPLDETP